jgi:putative oxidoreductase
MIATWILRCAEILIGSFYLGFGVANARSSREILDSLHDRHFPIPDVLFWGGVATQWIAGALLIIGYQTSLAAFVLIPFTLVASLTFHPFWSMEGEARFLNRIIFICNYTCVLAALLLIVGADGDRFHLLSFLQ